MIKLLLCAVVISGCAYVGASLSKAESGMIKTLYAVILFLEYFEKEISQSRASFDEITASYVNAEKEAEKFFGILSDKNSGKTPSCKLKDAANSANLPQSVKKELCELAAAISVTDPLYVGEKAGSAKRALREEYALLSKDQSAKSRLYRSVSALIGIAAAIVLY